MLTLIIQRRAQPVVVYVYVGRDTSSLFICYLS